MNLMGVWSGQYVTAESASNYIDAENIINDANKIKSELEEVDNLVRDIKNAGSDLTRNVLLIDDKDMSGNIGETVEFISSTKVNQCALLDGVIASAASAYNEKQDELNRKAQYENQKILQNLKNQNR